MKKKIFIISLIFLSIITAIGIWFVNNFKPGRNPDAERYTLNYSEEKVRKAIYEVKQENPDFVVTKTTIKNEGFYNLNDKYSEEPRYVYLVYFYFTEENQIVFTTVAGIGDNTTLSFVSINQGLDLGHWKDINSDFNAAQNFITKNKI